MKSLIHNIIAIGLIVPAFLFGARSDEQASAAQPHGMEGEVVHNDSPAELQQLIMRQSNDEATRRRVGGAIQSLSRHGANGAVVLETENFFPVELMKRFYDAICEQSRTDNASDFMKEMRLDGSVLVTPSAEHMAPILDYVGWLSKMLNRNLRDNEQVEVASVELRLTPGRDMHTHFGPWHTDDLFFTASTSLLGDGTEYFLETAKLNRTSVVAHRPEFEARKDAQATPRGRTLIISGDERGETFPDVHPTVHRAPPSRDRLYLAVRFGKKGTNQLAMPSVPLVLFPGFGK